MSKRRILDLRCYVEGRTAFAVLNREAGVPCGVTMTATVVGDGAEAEAEACVRAVEALTAWLWRWHMDWYKAVRPFAAALTDR